MKGIMIEFEDLVVEADLAATPCAQELYDVLPVEALVNTWGDEIYFEVPLTCGPDDTARETVADGDLGYWPTGRAFCIFFGPTPISGPGEIRPASAVNIIGRARGGTEVFKRIRDGAVVKLRRL